jgi:thiol-disulfide isomerase/thioredoxin
LTARAKEGNRMLAGAHYVTAPDTRIVIVLRASLANADTPPLPPPPAYVPKQEEPKKSTSRPMERPALANGPGWNPPAQSPASIGTPRPLTPVHDLPAPVSVPTPPTKPAPAVPAGGWVPGIAANETAGLPHVSIPNPLDQPPVQVKPPVPLPAPPVIGMVPTSTRVPSCVLVGRHLINFALYDLNHQPWEFKTQRHGKLALLDFWGSWCVPCKRTIPHLVNLQSQYGTAGLEVIGVAYERDGSFEEKAKRVGNACQANRINYRVLLGGEGDCPVRASFRINAIPTLILVNENGWILRRYEGEPDRAALEDLEFAIKQQLGVRP